MPPKKKTVAQTSAAKGSCCVCCQAVSSKDEALFCDGCCQQWLHRYCASVTVQQYKAIIDNNSSFLCPCCCRERQQEEIAALRNTVEAMKLEIVQLKESLTSLTTEVGKSYASRVAKNATSRGSRSRSTREQGDKRSERATPSITQPSSGAEDSGTDTKGSSATTSAGKGSTDIASGGKSKVKVAGARRIWGTLKNSTTNTVKNVILRLCKVDGEIRVRRKDKEGKSKKSTWWYVVHGDEHLLTELESKWASVNLQTSWKLEPCFKIESLEIPSLSVPTEVSQFDVDVTVTSEVPQAPEPSQPNSVQTSVSNTQQSVSPDPTTGSDPKTGYDPTTGSAPTTESDLFLPAGVGNHPRTQ